MTIQIDRRSGMSPDAFAREYVEGLGSPVIVTDAMTRWPARTKWTFEYFKSTYGDDTVMPGAWMGSAPVKVTKLSDYVDYIDDPSRTPRGFWIDPASRLPLAAPPAAATGPLYLLEWHGFQRHPELCADIEPPPGFIEDWVLALTPPLRSAFEAAARREYWSIFTGPAGSLSRLHVDYWHTHSYLAQVQGRKRCLLFPPGDAGFLYGGRVDPEQPDFEQFPSLQQATTYEAIIGPGDMLYTPPGWWHHVRALEKSITVSHNFFNRVNFAQHIGAFIRELPAFVASLEHSPEARKALDITWDDLGLGNQR